MTYVERSIIGLSIAIIGFTAIGVAMMFFSLGCKIVGAF